MLQHERTKQKRMPTSHITEKYLLLQYGRKIAKKFAAIATGWHYNNSCALLLTPGASDPTYAYLCECDVIPTTHKGALDSIYIEPDGKPKRLHLKDVTIHPTTGLAQLNNTNDPAQAWDLMVPATSSILRSRTFYINTYESGKVDALQWDCVSVSKDKLVKREVISVDVVQFTNSCMYLRTQCNEWYRLFNAGAPLYFLCSQKYILCIDIEEQSQENVQVYDTSELLQLSSCDWINESDWKKITDPGSEDPASVDINELSIDFEKVILSQLMDPYVDADALSDLETDYHYCTGSEEGLMAGVRMIAQALVPDKYFTAGDSAWATIVTATEDEGAYLCVDMWHSSSNSVDTYLVENPECAYYIDHIISMNEPCGQRYEYNDGPVNRQSGYNRQGLTVEISISKPSAHERLQAKLDLMSWIENNGLKRLE